MRHYTMKLRKAGNAKTLSRAGPGTHANVFESCLKHSPLLAISIVSKRKTESYGRKSYEGRYISIPLRKILGETDLDINVINDGGAGWGEQREAKEKIHIMNPAAVGCQEHFPILASMNTSEPGCQRTMGCDFSSAAFDMCD
ncbi:uncharacterized protein MONOS_12183 [Monocercomonoides exilis]|uniref:uncharacterized protein n=1 Tax=Monocercomonoides exilis TaxID=2049356 RepID=UPI00355AA26F|nr:hypothetical protein MONOS_12183 [Monocercomonoides exilis]|eukprot:MONOS_12183.1-p1 / transcript=MONOS_12183.1 / gene=MONOS_12183 / organism=Monocercomonoides_exilis_PA203 / gene_product=unspecified product / transcript_product=unspecified product / location=Mono_scaffold00657:15916-16341(+) / protein_length=142 / sequence_SO=supercontig / SO=protein_coding / is_pseudo=false